MPWVADEDLQLTPPVNTSGKRYNSMGRFMPLLNPYLGQPAVFTCPPVGLITNAWDRRTPEKNWRPVRAGRQ